MNIVPLPIYPWPTNGKETVLSKVDRRTFTKFGLTAAITSAIAPVPLMLSAGQAKAAFQAAAVIGAAAAVMKLMQPKPKRTNHTTAILLELFDQFKVVQNRLNNVEQKLDEVLLALNLLPETIKHVVRAEIKRAENRNFSVRLGALLRTLIANVDAQRSKVVVDATFNKIQEFRHVNMAATHLNTLSLAAAAVTELDMKKAIGATDLDIAVTKKSYNSHFCEVLNPRSGDSLASIYYAACQETLRLRRKIDDRIQQGIFCSLAIHERCGKLIKYHTEYGVYDYKCGRSNQLVAQIPRPQLITKGHNSKFGKGPYIITRVVNVRARAKYVHQKSKYRNLHCGHWSPRDAVGWIAAQCGYQTHTMSSGPALEKIELNVTTEHTLNSTNSKNVLRWFLDKDAPAVHKPEIFASEQDLNAGLNRKRNEFHAEVERYNEKVDYVVALAFMLEAAEDTITYVNSA